MLNRDLLDEFSDNYWSKKSIDERRAIDVVFYPAAK